VLPPKTPTPARCAGPGAGEFAWADGPSRRTV